MLGSMIIRASLNWASTHGLMFHLLPASGRKTQSSHALHRFQPLLLLMSKIGILDRLANESAHGFTLRLSKSVQADYLVR
jgi:hypothetical protein